MVKFKGDGRQFFYGIPTRDLTDEEWQALTADDRKAALASGLYEKVEEKPVKAKAEPPATFTKPEG